MVNDATSLDIIFLHKFKMCLYIAVIVIFILILFVLSADPSGHAV